MNEVIRFALLGLGVGALYAFASQGLIVIFRGTGVLNFSLGCHGHRRRVPGSASCSTSTASNFWLALARGGAVVGHVGGAHPLGRHAAAARNGRARSSNAGDARRADHRPGGVVIRYGSSRARCRPELPTSRVTLYGDVSITVDRLILLAIAGVLSVRCCGALPLVAVRDPDEAVAENQRAAAAIGRLAERSPPSTGRSARRSPASPAILVAPIVTLQVTTMTNLVLAAMAAALVADFRSFPIAYAAGVVARGGQTLVGRYGDQQGVDQSLPFAVIILVLVLPGPGSIPLRDYFLQQAAGDRQRPGLVGLDVFVVGAVVFLMLTKARSGTTRSPSRLPSAIVLLSIVVVTGYAGQLSLASSRWPASGPGSPVVSSPCAGWPFVLALVAGVAGGRAARAGLRPPGRARPRHQPGHRHARVSARRSS